MIIEGGDHINIYTKTIERHKKSAQDAVISLIVNKIKKYNRQNFSWVQYTPYFNDGNVCEFGVYFFMNDEKDSSQEYDQICQELYELNIEESLLNYLFGEGKIIVNVDGSFVIEEYEHE
jgi:hypothetical protein